MDGSGAAVLMVDLVATEPAAMEAETLFVPGLGMHIGFCARLGRSWGCSALGVDVCCIGRASENDEVVEAHLCLCVLVDMVRG